MSVETKQREKLDYINVASVISAFAVVMLHTNYVFWDYQPDTLFWKSANVIETVCYFAVPVFFMISAATLMDFNKRYGIKTYFIKRFRRAVVPFIAWSLIGLAYKIYPLRYVSPQDITPKFIISGLLNGSLVDIYWFFIPLFCIYLSLPLFAAIPNEKRKTLFTYLAVAGFLLNILPPFLLGVTGKELPTGLSVGVVAGYLFYVPVGYLISRYEITPKARIIIYVLGVSGLAMHMFGTFIYSRPAGEISGVFKGYQNVPCVLYSIAVFVFIRYATPHIMKHKPLAWLTNTLRTYTLSIYLLHIYVVRTLARLFDGIGYSLTYRLLAPFGIVIIAVFGAWVIRKIPVVREILP